VTACPLRADPLAALKLVVFEESPEGKTAMMLSWITSDGVSNHALAELPELRKRTDGFLWLDIPEWSEELRRFSRMSSTFIQCRSPKARIVATFPESHVYPHHVFIVVHAPEIGAAGHVHYLELDQFIGEDYLVTVHGPISPKVPLQAALRETEAVATRMDSGRLRPTSPFGHSYAIVSSIARRESHMVDEIAREVGLMEQQVTADVDQDPQKFLSELFAARHELLTIKRWLSRAARSIGGLSGWSR
jgi:magnesium transporter